LSLLSRAPVCAIVVGAIAAASSARADPAGGDPTPAPAARLPLQADLDGLYLHVGPQAGAVWRTGAWDSVVGGEVSLLRLREDEPLALVGGRAIGGRWATAHGGRVGLEGVVGIRPLGVLVGVAAGPLIDLGDLHHPRAGASAAIWCYAGVVPYLRVGVIEASGGFVEAGVELPLPVWRARW
jgi:hypothetical protein